MEMKKKTKKRTKGRNEEKVACKYGRWSYYFTVDYLKAKLKFMYCVT